MDSTRTEAPAPPSPNPPKEQRAAPRHLILQRCTVRVVSADRKDSFPGVAFDLSTIGIAVAVPRQIPIGTVLIVDSVNNPFAVPVEARVVRLHPLSQLWLCGCELTIHLNDYLLHGWLAGAKEARIELPSQPETVLADQQPKSEETLTGLGEPRP